MRKSEINRVTNETKIHMLIELDGQGNSEISTGVGFLDHMLTHVAKHGFFDLKLEAGGDLNVDCHHTVEDIGIVLGKCLTESLGKREGISRYGQCILPMEEAFVLCAVDISGRPCLGFDVEFKGERLGDLDTQMIEEFFRALCQHGGLNLHFKVLAGKNDHHIAEALFKAFGRALDMAVTIDPRVRGVLSTKGMLEG